MSGTPHTDTPWAIETEGRQMRQIITGRSERWGQDTGIVRIATIERHHLGSADHVSPVEIQQANAQFIVRAVNSHEVLVVALNNLMDLAHCACDFKEQTSAEIWSRLYAACDVAQSTLHEGETV